jgi:multidrug efflux pump subunit AcrB
MFEAKLAGTSPEQTNLASNMIEEALQSMPHVETVFAMTGGHLYGGVVSERPGFARMAVKLADAAERPELPAGLWVRQANQKLRSLDIPNAGIWIRPPRIPGLNFGASGDDMEVMIVGEDLDLMQALARELLGDLEGIEGLADLQMSRDDRMPLLNINVDRERAAALGLNVAEVGRSLRDAVTGAIPTRYSTGGEEYDIRVRLPREVTSDPNALSQLMIAAPDGRPVQLSEVATFALGDGPEDIERENQMRVQRITGSFNTELNDVGSIMQATRDRVDQLGLPNNYGVIFGGQFETIEETNQEMFTVILLALFLVFVVLTVQYERLANPIVIMAAAPLSVIGVVASLWVTGTPLSAPAFYSPSSHFDDHADHGGWDAAVGAGDGLGRELDAAAGHRGDRWLVERDGAEPGVDPVPVRDRSSAGPSAVGVFHQKPQRERRASARHPRPVSGVSARWGRCRRSARWR